MLGFDGKPPSDHKNTKTQINDQLDNFEKENEHRTLSSFSVDFESAAHDSQELVSPCCINSLKIDTLSCSNNEPTTGGVMSNIDRVNISEKLPVDVPEWGSTIRLLGPYYGLYWCNRVNEAKSHPRFYL